MSNLSLLFQGKTANEVKAASDKIQSLIKAKKIDKDTVSILDVAESILGHKCVSDLRRANSEDCFGAVRESADPVNLTAFTNITGLLILQNVVEEYRKPEFIGEQLFTMETSREDNTREPGLALIDDKALVVPEGEEYPDMKFGEDFIDIPKSKKRGAKIGLTREMIFFDRTNQLNEMARGVGERIGTDREKRMLRVFLGIDNSFNRKGVARNTYVAAGGGEKRPNLLASTPLVDWTSIDTANQLFTAMTDDRSTGEPIEVVPDTIVVSKYKWMNALRILNATSQKDGTNLTSGYPSRVAEGNNILNMLGLKPLTSVWLDWLLVNENSVSASNAKDYWTIGQPKKAFRYRTLFPLNVRASSPNDVDDFERDVVLKYRADERGVPYVRAPWYVAQLHNG